MANEPKVCLADDDPMTIESITDFVRKAGYSIVICKSRRELLHAICDQRVFCVIIEAGMLETTDLNVPLFRSYGTSVILTSNGVSPNKIVETIKAGAIDFFIKPVNPINLVAAVHEASRRQQTCRDLANIHNRFGLLTEREKEVFSFVTTGMLNKQIAAHLGISEKTIKVHRGRVMGKMKVASFAELVRSSDKLAALGSNSRSGATISVPPIRL